MTALPASLQPQLQRVFIPAHRAGKTVIRDDALDAALLGTLFDHGGEMGFHQLWQLLPCTRRELMRAIGRQHDLANIRRWNDGQPVTLTRSARVAIAAGRNFPALRTVTL